MCLFVLSINSFSTDYWEAATSSAVLYHHLNSGMVISVVNRRFCPVRMAERDWITSPSRALWFPDVTSSCVITFQRIEGPGSSGLIRPIPSRSLFGQVD